MIKNQKRPLPKSGVERVGCLVLLSILAAFCLLVVCFLIDDNFFYNWNPYEKERMVRVSQSWGRFANFPPESVNFKIRTEGGFFSRSYEGSFQADIDILERWIEESEGLDATNFTREAGSGFEVFEVAPGGGAGFGTVKLDRENEIIYFSVSWS